MERIRTQRVLAIILFAITLLAIGWSIKKVEAQSQYPHPRFEQVLLETRPEATTSVGAFEVWHDKETGQEFICVAYRGNSLSCFQTGRSWLNGN